MSQGVKRVKHLTSTVLVVLILAAPSGLCQTATSQRPLPLPQQARDQTQHLEALRLLRSAIRQSDRQQAANNPSQQQNSDDETIQSQADAALKAAEKLDPQQLRQLGDMFRSLADQLPPGLIPQALNSVPEDRLKEAMQNPVVQNQMRRLLEQFARDGLIPPARSGEPLFQPPLPPSESVRSTAHNHQTANRSDRDSRSDPDDPASAQESDQEPNGNRRSNPGTSHSSGFPGSPISKDSPQRPEDGGKASTPTLNQQPALTQSPSESLRNSSDPQDRRLSGSQIQADSANTNGAGNTSLDSAGSRPQIPRSSLKQLEKFLNDLSNASPPAPRGSAERDSQRPGNGASGNPQARSLSQPNPDPQFAPTRRPLRRRDPADSRDPAESRPTFVPPDGQAMPLDSTWPRDGVSGKDSQSENRGQAQAFESLQKIFEQMSEDESGTGSMESPAGDVKSGIQSLLESGLLSGAGNRSRDTDAVASGRPPVTAASEDSLQFDRNLSENSQKLIQEVWQRAAQQLSQSGTQFAPAPTASGRSGNPVEGERAHSGRTNPRMPQNVSGSMPDRPAKPPVNIVQELEQKGLGETLRGIVESAKQESRQPLQPLQPPGNRSTGDPAGPGELGDATVRLLDRLKDDLAEIAKDAKFREPRPRPAPVSVPEPGPKKAAPEDSTLSQLRNTASDFFGGSEKSDTPDNGAAVPSLPNMAAPISAEFDLLPAAIFAGLLGMGLVALLSWKSLASRQNDDPESHEIQKPIAPSQVRTRTDVVRAFHQVVSRSAEPFQKWWTHRTAERTLAAENPDCRNAVSQLADVYEKARYLPEHEELSAESLEEARRALQQCSRF